MARRLPNGLAYTVEIAFPASATFGDVFLLSDPVKGKLDDATYVLGGDIFVDITEDVTFVSVDRGRSNELDAFNAGTAKLEIIDLERKYDPNNADSPYFRGVRPRRRVRISVEDNPIFNGWVIDWQFITKLGEPLTVSATCADAFQILSNAQLDGFTPATTDLAHVRIGQVLSDSRVGWPADERSIGTGVTTVDDEPVEGDALAYLQVITRAEQGYVFINRQGFVAFRGRNETSTTAVKCRFGDDADPDSVPYRNFNVDYSADMLYNRVIATRTDGTPQIVDDSPSQDEYLVSTLNYSGLPLSTDAQALTLANLLLDRYADPRTRVESVETQIAEPGPPWLDAILLELGDKVRIIKQFDPGAFWPIEDPFSTAIKIQTDDDDDLQTDGDVDLLIDFGNVLDAELAVQKISHQISTSRHVLTVGLAPVYD